MRSRVQLQPSFVLHRRLYGETSLLVEAFCVVFGRVGLVAKGARQRKAAWGALLQPFRPLLLSWQGRSELGLLTGAEVAMPWSSMDGRALLSGFYLNELLLRLLPRHDPQPRLFESYGATVCHLTARGAEEPVLRIFEKRLLDALGYGLMLDGEADLGQAIDPTAVYCYQIDRGPVRASGAGLGDMRVSGRTLLALAREQIDDPSELREAKCLLRRALQRQLGGRPLVSRSLFRRSLDSQVPPGVASTRARLSEI